MKVLGIELYDQGIEKLCSDIIVRIRQKQAKHSHCISATDAHGLVLANKSSGFKKVLESFYLRLPDGAPSVWISRMKGAKNVDRCYGPDVFLNVIKNSRNATIKHFFCGGKPGVAEELRRRCEEEYENYNIVGLSSPPFRDLSSEEFIALGEQINDSNADIVWIGLGSPKQEYFAHELAKHCSVYFIVTIGAAFDFHTGKVLQAPKIVQQLGLEWLFRLLTEPKRLWKRYFEVIPKFIFLNVVEVVNYLKASGSKKR